MQDKDRDRERERKEEGTLACHGRYGIYKSSCVCTLFFLVTLQDVSFSSSSSLSRLYLPLFLDVFFSTSWSTWETQASGKEGRRRSLPAVVHWNKRTHFWWPLSPHKNPLRKKQTDTWAHMVVYNLDNTTLPPPPPSLSSPPSNTRMSFFFLSFSLSIRWKKREKERIGWCGGRGGRTVHWRVQQHVSPVTDLHSSVNNNTST